MILRRIKVIVFCSILGPVLGWTYGEEGVTMGKWLMVVCLYQLVMIVHVFGVWETLWRKIREEANGRPWE